MKCKHEWYFIREEDNREFGPVQHGKWRVLRWECIKHATKFYAIFVCHKCGDTKKVEMKGGKK